MFRPSYLKEGPGIAKDAPEKTGAAWVGETLAREFWQLVKLNVLFLLCCLPVVTFGAARAAMARCTVNMARDVPNDAWTDFRAALRQDTVRNLLCGLAELALLWMGVMLVTADGFFPALLGMLLLCVTAAFFQNFWAVQAAVDIPFAAAAKNAWLLCLLRPGIVQGMRPVIGYNYGAGERERVSRIFQVALALCACIMMIGTVLCLAFASPLMALFTENIRTVVIGAHALRIICVGFLVSAVSVTASGALEGLGKGTASLVISLCRYTVVILPITVVLCRIMGANGVWHAFWVTEFISAGVALVAWKRV